jgi:hypothetical protein
MTTIMAMATGPTVKQMSAGIGRGVSGEAQRCQDGIAQLASQEAPLSGCSIFQSLTGIVSSYLDRTSNNDGQDYGENGLALTLNWAL